MYKEGYFGAELSDTISDYSRSSSCFQSMSVSRNELGTPRKVVDVEMEEAGYYLSDVEMEDAPGITPGPCCLSRIGLEKIEKRKKHYKARAESKLLRDARKEKAAGAQRDRRAADILDRRQTSTDV